MLLPLPPGCVRRAFQVAKKRSHWHFYADVTAFSLAMQMSNENIAEMREGDSDAQKERRERLIWACRQEQVHIRRVHPDPAADTGKGKTF